MPKKPKDAEISFIAPPAPDEVQIPEQKEHFKLPTRFGAVPLDEAPLGYVVETRKRETKVTKFEHAYPKIYLPFQEVQRVEFGHNAEFLKQNEKDAKLRALFPTGANRLFFGDNLHVMRQLPSESIDLIYIDPPFFSGRNYNVLFGDKNEMRSFSDIWEGGMPGYLVWLNARLFEIKRLLKKDGSICVHLDWHASHYVKVEMDKVFGYATKSAEPGFKNEIIWCYSIGGKSKRTFARKHDIILWYTKGKDYIFNEESSYARVPKKPNTHMKLETDKNGVVWQVKQDATTGKIYRYPFDKIAEDYWTDIEQLNREDVERIGYPTQKPRELLERIIGTLTNENGVIADFFCGGGTTPVVAQKLNRRWIACDQSRIAVSITADRIAKAVEQEVGKLFPVPDFTVEHWGIYEIPPLEKFTEDKFREFVVKAFGGKPEGVSPAIHGVRHGVPLYVGKPTRATRISKDDVARFAKAIYEERRANHGVMLAWNFGQDARKAAEILAARENKRIDFVLLDLVRLESDEFREHVITKHKDYDNLLAFIQPPQVRIAVERIGERQYRFDVSESVSLNKDGIIANVQWDFDHEPGRFTSTQGYSFLRDKNTHKPLFIAEYTFPKSGKHTIACSVQDDQGGEHTEVLKVEVH